MSTVITSLFLLPSLCVLLLLVIIPSAFANRHVRGMIRLATAATAMTAVAGLIGLLTSQLVSPTHVRCTLIDFSSPIQLSVYVDGISALMLTLVASVGWVVCKFSVRYLDGEPQQGNYFRWTGFTIGAVSLFVVAGNVPLMIFGLLLTSIGLHYLLVHYKDRPAARRAAATKFVFSRIGDVCLAIAGVLLFKEFGTLEFPQLFAAATAASDAVVSNSRSLPIAGGLLVMCAVFKSAQFPFHTWLPETMEAPTPVSAMMHAGIVNAGGYLLIRMAPVVSLAPAAMWLAAGLGAFTAIFAALVMMSQTSVKRTLAWSTIAQMGFMILQCGLGAFSAAMLHIIAHSLYKAHAFLSSGSVMADSYAMAGVETKTRSGLASAAAFCVAAALTGGIFISASSVVGVSLVSKPGGFLLGFVLCLSLTRWQWQTLLNGPQFLLRGIATTMVLIAAYLVSFSMVDAVVVGAFEEVSVAGDNWLLNSLAIAFAALMFGELLIRKYARSAWLQRLYVHSSNGFYLDTIWNRATKVFSA